MSKPTATWKGKERDLNKPFGSLRNRLSGSSGRADQTRSDGTHPRLFLECKHTQHSTALNTLYRKTAAMAKVEGKIPVLGMTADRGPMLVVMKLSDLRRVAAELIDD